MKRQYRILLEDKLLPVQVFFNAIADANFLNVLAAFSKGIGAGFDIATCTFPGDLEEWEDPLDGIEFALSSGESIVLSFSEFEKILEKVCAVHVEDNPGSKKDVIRMLKDIKEMLRKPDAAVFKPGHNYL